MSQPDIAADRFRVRVIAITCSFGVGVGLMALKFYAYWLTESAAIFSDALESIINVVASAFAGASILLAAKSPDATHPYGHGKIEYFSAGFEGALIILAAGGIVVQAWPQLFHPRGIPHLQFGLLLILGASAVNLFLSLGLIIVGKRTRSLALEADGRHILTDVYTSIGVLAGLSLAWWTGWYWLDGAVALVLGMHILITGATLVRQAFQGLMDASDPDLLQEISDLLRSHRKDRWIDIHRLRARRAGDRVLLDFHLILPQDLSLGESHREVRELEGVFTSHFGPAADVLIHVDPCAAPVCPVCGLDPCRLRQEQTSSRKLWRREVLTGGEEGSGNLG